MVDNKDLTLLKEIHNIEHARSKYFFIGFIAALIPYIMVLLAAYRMDVSKLFILIILSFMILTALFNAIYLSISIHKKLITYFENKYEISYKEIKESLIWFLFLFLK